MPRLKLLLLFLTLGLPVFLLSPGEVLAAQCTANLQCISQPTTEGCVPNPDRPGEKMCSNVGCITNIQCLANPSTNGCIPDPNRPGTKMCDTSLIQGGLQEAAGVGNSLICTGTNCKAGLKTVQGDCAEGEVETALGCINFNLSNGRFLESILTLAIGVGGAIALMLMLYGFFILSTSAGIPDKVKEGQEIITGAVGGLIFILFATIMMNLIGIKIFNLPGLQ